MHYQGGKRRLAPRFAGVLDAALAGAECFVEPFVGGFNVVPALRIRPERIRCSDSHPGVVALWRAVQGGWKAPESLSEGEYRELRRVRDWTNPLTAFALFGCSFGGKEDGSYARPSRTRPGASYARESARGIERKRGALQGVEMTHLDYKAACEGLGQGAVVYCDPPYRGTKRYAGKAFDHDEFVTWAEELASRGVHVFVSEFEGSVPGSWEVAWREERQVAIGDGRRQVVEVLARVLK